MVRSLMGRSPSLRSVAGAVLAVAATLVATSSLQAADLPEGWFQDFDQAKAKAAETKKPIMAVFSASWCGPCQHMVRNVYPQPEVIAELDKWVPVYIDGDENETITRDMKVRGYPTYVLLDSSATETYRIVGASQDKDAFIGALHRGVEFTTKSEPFRTRLASNSNDAEALRNIGALHVETGQDDMAEEYYIRALEIDPKTTTGIPAHLVKKAEKSLARKATDERLAKAIEANPKDVAALTERGHLSLSSVLKDGDEAVESARTDFSVAAEVDAENTSVKEGQAFLQLLDSLFESEEPDSVGMAAFRTAYPKSAHLETLDIVDFFIAMNTEDMAGAVGLAEAYLAKHPEGYMVEEITDIIPRLKMALEMQSSIESGDIQMEVEVIEEAE